MNFFYLELIMLLFALLPTTMNKGIYDMERHGKYFYFYMIENNIKDEREKLITQYFLRPGIVKINLTRSVYLKHNLFWP